jgi:uncharacterized protein
MLKQQIELDVNQSMRDKDELKTSTLRMLLSAVKYFEIATARDYQATDEDVTITIQKEVKKRREAVEMYQKGNRPELAEKETKEMEILQAYLPKQMAEDELRKIITETVKKTGASSVQDIGKVMGALMPLVKGKADGSMVGKIVREELSK